MLSIGYVASLLGSGAAWADPVQNPNPGMSSLVIMVGTVLIFYFFIIRPQSLKVKEQRALLDSLAQGDEVAMHAGMLGQIVALDEHYVLVQVGEGVRLRFQRSAVARLLPKGTIKGLDRHFSQLPS